MKNRFMFFCIALILLCTSCSKEHQYEFPMTKETLEKAFTDHKLNWTVDDAIYSKDENPYSIFKVKDNNITYTILTNTYEDSKILKLSIYFKPEFTKEQINEYYKNDIKKFFDFWCDFYYDSREIKKGLKEFYKYYNQHEGNFEGGLYWTKRIGDNVVLINIEPMFESDKNGNNVFNSNFISVKSYEDIFLSGDKKSLINTAKRKKFEISYNNIAKMKEFVLPAKEEDFHGKHFMVKGHLEDIKEMKTVPESLKNTRSSSLLKPNRDKYMMAKLVDETGSVDVFLQTTPLTKEELGMEREHNIVLFYYDDEPFYVARFSVLSE